MLKKIVIHDRIVKEVKKIIKERNMQIGDKLPTQQEFTEMFGLSRNSMREAFRTMQALKIIEVINGKGMYVKNNNFVDEDEKQEMDKKQKLTWILDVRRSMEVLAATLAVDNRTEDDLNAMEKELTVMHQKEETGEPHAAEDKAFHYAVFNASHNLVLLDGATYLEGWFNEFWENPLGAGKALREGRDYHELIYKAILKRDKKAVKMAYDKMFDQVEVIIRNI